MALEHRLDGRPVRHGPAIQLAYARFRHGDPRWFARQAEFATDPVFGLHVPKAVHGVPSEVLMPKNTWKDGKAYDAQAAKLAKGSARTTSSLRCRRRKAGGAEGLTAIDVHSTEGSVRCPRFEEHVFNNSRASMARA